MSFARQLKRNTLKKYTKEQEKKIKEQNPNGKLKGLQFNKYWQQYQKAINQNGREQNN